MHIQMEEKRVDKAAPSSTNMRDLTPPKSDIPGICVIQSIIVENAEKCVIIKPVDSRVLHRIFWSP